MLKRKIPLLITFIVGLVFLIGKFIPHKPFCDLEEDFSIYFDVIATFAFVLGAGSLLKTHIDKIQKKKEGFGYSIVTIVSFFVVLFIGFAKFGNPSGFFKSSFTEQGGYFFWIYQYILEEGSWWEPDWVLEIISGQLYSINLTNIGGAINTGIGFIIFILILLIIYLKPEI